MPKKGKKWSDSEAGVKQHASKLDTEPGKGGQGKGARPRHDAKATEEDEQKEASLILFFPAEHSAVLGALAACGFGSDAGRQAMEEAVINFGKEPTPRLKTAGVCLEMFKKSVEAVESLGQAVQREEEIEKRATAKRPGLKALLSLKTFDRAGYTALTTTLSKGMSTLEAAVTLGVTDGGDLGLDEFGKFLSSLTGGFKIVEYLIIQATEALLGVVDSVEQDRIIGGSLYPVINEVEIELGAENSAMATMDVWLSLAEYLIVGSSTTDLVERMLLHTAMDHDLGTASMAKMASKLDANSRRRLIEIMNQRKSLFDDDQPGAKGRNSGGGKKKDQKKNSRKKR